MNKTSAFTPGKSQQSNTAEDFLRANKPFKQPGFDSFFKASTNPASANNGFDFSQIPARPQLQTNNRVQCCGKDGDSCSCPKCKQASSNDGDTAVSDEGHFEQSSADAQSIEQTSTEPIEATSEFEPGTTVSEQPSATGLIVDDSATELSEGQMTKTQFLQSLRTEICNTIGPVLATVGQTTEDCPYLNYWLDLYQEKDAAHIERTAKKYAPDINDAKTAEEYISIIAQRALRAALIWATTGKVTGVPEGVPATLPNETASQKENKEAGQNVVQAKSKKGGVKNANDPRAIQKELGNGQPLATNVRSRMESAFGVSFSNVRTHTDSKATGLSNRLNARAFTVGNHVSFGSGEYRPGTLLGDALIAHELAHTMQQAGAEQSVDKMEIGSERYNQLEADADNTAIGAMSSLLINSKSLFKNVKYSMPALRSGLKIQRCKTVNEKPNPCTTRATPASPVKTMTIRPTYLWGGSTSGKFTSQVAYANNVFKPAGLEVKGGNVETVNEADTKTLLGTNALLNVSGNPPQKSSYTAEEKALLAKNSASNEVSLYYIKKMENISDAWALTYLDSDAIVEETTTTDRVLAHEIGHLIGGGGHPSNLDNFVAKSTSATGVDCISDDQIEAARKNRLFK